MKRALLARRSAVRRAAPRISLFPFLAVLICTMGALVPLLLAMARQARLSAAAEAAARTAARQSDLQDEREGAEWRSGQLKVARQKTEAQLQEARAYLGHVEDHARRLREQAGQLQATLAEVDRAGQLVAGRREQLTAEATQLQSNLAAAQQRVESARAEAGRRPQSYAILPYDGPNGTHRRPIYLECTPDAVVLQPEGVRLVASDFEGPMGIGNPLAAILRATREYWIKYQGFDPEKEGEPYPLLLVRPGGVPTYYVAREAMQPCRWEFGYELIEADWRLAYPPPDAALARLAQQTLQQARVEQQVLIAAAPRHYGRSRTTGPSGGGGYGGGPGSGGYGGGPGGGGTPGDGGYGGGLGGTSGGVGGGLVAGREFGGASGPSGSGGYDPGGSALAATGETGSFIGGGGPSGGGSVFGGAHSGDSGSGGPGPIVQTPAGRIGRRMESGTAAGGSSGTGRATGETARGDSEDLQAIYGPSDAGAEPSSPSGRPNALRTPEGYVVGRPTDLAPPPRAGGEQPQHGPTVAVQPLRPGEWREPPPKIERPREDPKKKPHDERRPRDLAKKGGKDWGLPQAADKATPVARPIAGVCYGDRLELHSESGEPRIVRLSARTDHALDELIGALWVEMDSWGIAGKGMYWRPILRLHVAAGGEPRFQDLQSLLSGSGVEVEKK